MFSFKIKYTITPILKSYIFNSQNNLLIKINLLNNVFTVINYLNHLFELIMCISKRDYFKNYHKCSLKHFLSICYHNTKIFLTHSPNFSAILPCLAEKLAENNNSYSLTIVIVSCIITGILGYSFYKYKKGGGSGGGSDDPSKSLDEETSFLMPDFGWTNSWYSIINKQYYIHYSYPEPLSGYLHEGLSLRMINNLVKLNCDVLYSICKSYTNDIETLNIYFRFLETVRLKGGINFTSDIFLTAIMDYNVNMYVLNEFEVGLCQFLYLSDLGFKSQFHVQLCLKYALVYF